MTGSGSHGWKVAVIVTVLLALPVLGVHAWMAWTFPSYLRDGLVQGVVFTFALCTLLALVARLRLLHVASVPVALMAYLAWLFLVLGEGVSYYLQADTFNARFFANLNLDNLTTGLRAFPAMIGGGIALLVAMLVVGTVFLARLAHRGRAARTRVHHGIVVAILVVLVMLVAGVNSAPRRLVGYLTQVQRAEHLAGTLQGKAVVQLLDTDPVPKADVIAAPGRNVVWLYLESLERTYWDPKVFPGLTPNLDRLRREGLDFSGFQTYAGANYTIAGMFASQCGVPMFTSPFAGLDAAAGNTTDATTFHPRLTCFGDVLRKAGYRQIYLGGAPIVFSNKGLFFRLHGYDQALGLKQLEAAHGGKLPEEGWGLYDRALFKLALERYQKLEAGGRPFNLAMITLDTHPPKGRPSPGCPTYAASSNSMLQAVHCTDYLVGKFIDALKQQPGWKNTVVVIMSDHLMMRNDAEPLYPKGYHRQPALLVLNAGQGVRPARMYHMDIAPTVLHLMGVRTNATFIAGRDRSGPRASSSKLVDDATDVAVLRKVLWSRVRPLQLCQNHTLIRQSGQGEFDVGGRTLKTSYRGQDVVGIRDGQVLDIFVGKTNATLLVADAKAQPGLLKSRGGARVLIIRALPASERNADLFTVDWVGRGGARAHIADVPRLGGLSITSSRCSKALTRVDTAPPGKLFDLTKTFHAATTLLPVLPAARAVDFRKPEAVAFEAGYGWFPPKPWGSWAIGDEAVLDFRLPRGLCHKARLRLRVNPYLPPSRPALDAEVRVNGKLATTWHFVAPHSRQGVDTAPSGSDDPAVVQVETPVDTEGTCRARVSMRFSRPHAALPPYPKGEDSRPLQFSLGDIRLVPAKAFR